ncbi:MAG: uracil-DNA glycosylase [Gemmatimonadaceae bacterium]|nr:uracil-DNA glycosylase [Gemmatimonadaceae bacterium]
MNARERLRAYLEQRRELGESEMLLDALGVDDVMRMLGALPGDGGATAAVPAAAPRPVPTRAAPRDDAAAVAPDRPVAPPRAGDDGPRPPREAREPGAPVEQGDDWREMMQRLQSAAPARPVPAAPESLPAAADDAPPPPRKTGTLALQEGAVFPRGLRVERPPLIGVDPGAAWQSIDAVNVAIAACKACDLVRTATQPVPGIGNPLAEVLVVGEAPGEKEDLRGEPFVGPAGELLDKILGAIQLDRTTIYICNVLKHRPPGNRTPTPEEVRACAPFLQRQVDLVQPKLILAFGASAAQALLGTKLGIGQLRQQLHWYQGIPLVATYHPAALLRNDAWKRPTWEDVKLARRVLDATLRA